MFIMFYTCITRSEHYITLYMTMKIQIWHYKFTLIHYYYSYISPTLLINLRHQVSLFVKYTDNQHPEELRRIVHSLLYQPHLYLSLLLLMFSHKNNFILYVYGPIVVIIKRNTSGQTISHNSLCAIIATANIKVSINNQIVVTF